LIEFTDGYDEDDGVHVVETLYPFTPLTPLAAHVKNAADILI